MTSKQTTPTEASTMTTATLTDIITERRDELMQLRGSPKQVSWAQSIKSRAMPEIAKLCQMSTIGRELTTRGYTGADLAELGVIDAESCQEFCVRVLRTAICDDRASWWIDHRESADLDAWMIALDIYAPRKS